MSKSEVVYIGLGSNQDDPENQIKNALTSLKHLPSSELMRVSSLYKTKAVGPPQDDYLNACAELSTKLSPSKLLTELQRIELEQKRTRDIHWGPRTIDLDILLFGSKIIHTTRLVVPHPELFHRDFVLLPLFEINPDLILPCHTPLKSIIGVQKCENTIINIKIEGRLPR